jgi:hypothetical protein
MPAIIDRAGRQFNADETDGVSRRQHLRCRGKLVVGGRAICHAEPGGAPRQVDVLVVGETEYTGPQFLPVLLYQYR